MFKKIDGYIIKKFWGSFFGSLALFIVISIIFDISEKLQNFLNQSLSLHDIVFKYYINFIPYFGILYAPLFLFVSVIFFTSRMAYRSEIIAMLSSGITFKRLLFPFLFASLVVMVLDIVANQWLVPDANKSRIAFEKEYIDGPSPTNTNSNVHMQVAKNQFIYLATYNPADTSGYLFNYEIFNNGQIQYKLSGEWLRYSKKQNGWTLKNYFVHSTDSMKESIHTGKDTLLHLNLKPNDFSTADKDVVTFNQREINEKIADLKLRGAENVSLYEVEKYKRTAFPFSIPILTLIGVALASRKVRGGSGLHLGIGIALSFSYILFQQFSMTFSIKGNLPPILGVWIPNFLFGIVAVYLYWRSPK